MNCNFSFALIRCTKLWHLKRRQVVFSAKCGVSSKSLQLLYLSRLTACGAICRFVWAVLRQFEVRFVVLNEFKLSSSTLTTKLREALIHTHTHKLELWNLYFTAILPHFASFLISAFTIQWKLLNYNNQAKSLPFRAFAFWVAKWSL